MGRKLLRYRDDEQLMQAQKPKLVPVGVPWMISPSVPYIKLNTDAGGPMESLDVTFVALFGECAKSSGVIEIGEKVPKVAEDPGPFKQAEEGAKSQTLYKMVRATFHGVLDSWAFSPLGEGEFEEQFDWSVVPHQIDIHNIEASRREFWSQWLRTGLCPDPLMYWVEPALSGWTPQAKEGVIVDVVRNERLQQVKSIPADGRMRRHFVLRGHDCDVEVIAEKWSWNRGQELPGW